jgi:hypothetical protein
MMAKNNPYFANAERRTALENELISWLGTSFIYNPTRPAKRRCSADCVTSGLGVFQNLGLFDRDFVIPYYSTVRGGKRDLDLLYSHLNSTQNLKIVWDRKDCPLKDFGMMDGDIIVCSSGVAVHHILIYLSGYAWHCWPGAGVVRVNYGLSFLHKRAQRIYRVYEQ